LITIFLDFVKLVLIGCSWKNFINKSWNKN
jgi:hypothetical protein